MKLVKQGVSIVETNCTGCYRCERACPTNAISMVGPRKSALAVVQDSACIACFRCLDVCPDEAIVIDELEQPHKVGTPYKNADPVALNDLCEASGLESDQVACLCSGTKVRELAAAVLAGAATFEELALATGAASGCLLYCSVPMRRVLEAHLGEVDESGSKVRRYDTDLVLLEVDESVADDYPHFGLRKEKAAAVVRHDRQVAAAQALLGRPNTQSDSQEKP